MSYYEEETTARLRGLSVRELMDHPSDWDVRVWDNMGWHWALKHIDGYIALYESQYGDEPATYHCLVGDNGSGMGIWTTLFHSQGPNEAVRHEVTNAFRVVNKYLDWLHPIEEFCDAEQKRYLQGSKGRRPG